MLVRMAEAGRRMVVETASKLQALVMGRYWGRVDGLKILVSVFPARCFVEQLGHGKGRTGLSQPRHEKQLTDRGT